MISVYGHHFLVFGSCCFMKSEVSLWEDSYKITKYEQVFLELSVFIKVEEEI
jgi:hypothetical protein